jgi:hypothetical protein
VPRLLRQLSRKEIWASYEPDPLWDQDDCPWKILDIMKASDGFSVWHVNEDDEIRRTVTATALLRSKIEDVVYVLLDQNVLRGLGIRMQPSAAKTLDDEINKKHHDLINITGKRFIQLAKLIRDALPVTVHHDEIMDDIKQGFRTGRFNRDSFAGRSGNIGLVTTLFRNGAIDFV